MSVVVVSPQRLDLGVLYCVKIVVITEISKLDLAASARLSSGLLLNAYLNLLSVGEGRWSE